MKNMAVSLNSDGRPAECSFSAQKIAEFPKDSKILKLFLLELATITPATIIVHPSEDKKTMSVWADHNNVFATYGDRQNCIEAASHFAIGFMSAINAVRYKNIVASDLE